MGFDPERGSCRYGSVRIEAGSTGECMGHELPRQLDIHGSYDTARWRARVRFHHMIAPVTTWTTAIRLASDIRVLVGMPKISPVWMARLTITMRAPAGAVREPSANSTFAGVLVHHHAAAAAAGEVLGKSRADLVGALGTGDADLEGEGSGDGGGRDLHRLVGRDRRGAGRRGGGLRSSCTARAGHAVEHRHRGFVEADHQSGEGQQQQEDEREDAGRVVNVEPESPSGGAAGDCRRASPATTDRCPRAAGAASRRPPT